MDHLLSVYKGQQCKVYFFKSWTTYSHPVRPINPMEYEEAVTRDGYYRAWMCGADDKKKFIFFDGIELSKMATDIKKSNIKSLNVNKLEFFEPILEKGKVKVGRPLGYSETLLATSFLVAIPDDTDILILIKQKSVVSYEYKYMQDGKLEQVVVKDFDGNIKLLDY